MKEINDSYLEVFVDFLYKIYKEIKIIATIFLITSAILTVIVLSLTPEKDDKYSIIIKENINLKYDISYSFEQIFNKLGFTTSELLEISKRLFKDKQLIERVSNELLLSNKKLNELSSSNDRSGQREKMIVDKINNIYEKIQIEDELNEEDKANYFLLSLSTNLNSQIAKDFIKLTINEVHKNILFEIEQYIDSYIQEIDNKKKNILDSYIVSLNKKKLNLDYEIEFFSRELEYKKEAVINMLENNLAVADALGYEEPVFISNNILDLERQSLIENIMSMDLSLNSTPYYFFGSKILIEEIKNIKKNNTIDIMPIARKIAELDLIESKLAKDLRNPSLTNEEYINLGNESKTLNQIRDYLVSLQLKNDYLFFESNTDDIKYINYRSFILYNFFGAYILALAFSIFLSLLIAEFNRRNQEKI
jgi:hypothetical protein